MKNIFTIFILLLAKFIFSQSSAFVLVDISGSGPSDEVRDDARKIVNDLCLGTFKPSSYSPDWEWIGTPAGPIQNIIGGKPNTALIDPGKDGFLIIMPFGAKNTYKQYKIGKLQSLPNELNDFFNKHYPSKFRDPFTYQKIAYAFAASLAKSRNIDSYYMLVVSDDLTDPDTGSQPPNYTKEEEEWLAGWGTSAAKTLKLATLKYNGDNTDYQIVISKVDIKNININPTNPKPSSVDKKNHYINPSYWHQA